MNSSTLNRIEPAVTPKPHFLDGLATRAVHQRLAGLVHGQVTLVDGRQPPVLWAARRALPAERHPARA